MVIHCSAPGCLAKKESVHAKSSVLFHRFPLRKPDVLAKWIKAIKSPSFKPTFTSYLCSAHFTNSDYDSKQSPNGQHLKPNAVPTVFEKRRPGRKKKIVESQSVEVTKNNTDSSKTNENEETYEEEYLQVETGEKMESNLAEIIGDREKGTLQVLIVGEDGKITNSEYIFKKEVSSDDEYKVEEQFLQNDNNSDDDSQFKETFNNKNKLPLDVSGLSYSELSNSKKIMVLENNLRCAKKKIKLLQVKCRKIKNQNEELSLLLKLLVLKRGKGERTLKQLVEEYEKVDDENIKVDIKEETSIS